MKETDVHSYPGSLILSQSSQILTTHNTYIENLQWSLKTYVCKSLRKFQSTYLRPTAVQHENEQRLILAPHKTMKGLGQRQKGLFRRGTVRNNPAGTNVLEVWRGTTEQFADPPPCPEKKNTHLTVRIFPYFVNIIMKINITQTSIMISKIVRTGKHKITC